MGRKGWWGELITNEYENTQTSYGDVKALEKPKDQKIPDQYTRTALQEKCAQCGKIYWIDKGCRFCKKTGSQATQSSTNIQRDRSHIKVLCPLCGSVMKLRVARQGQNKGKSFFGCSRYPKCKGTYTPPAS